jgi:hypothetical protein
MATLTHGNRRYHVPSADRTLQCFQDVFNNVSDQVLVGVSSDLKIKKNPCSAIGKQHCSDCVWHSELKSCGLVRGHRYFG